MRRYERAIRLLRNDRYVCDTDRRTIIFPYRRKDLFEASPPLVKKKIAGIPVITIFGAIAFFVSVGVA